MGGIGYAGFYTFQQDGLDFRFNGLKEITALQKQFEWNETEYNRSDECIRKYGGNQYCNITNVNAPPTVGHYAERER
jgi:hypothetical protein